MKTMISVILAMTTSVAIAGEPKLKECGDGYLGTSSFYYDCKVKTVNKCLDDLEYYGVADSIRKSIHFKDNPAEEISRLCKDYYWKDLAEPKPEHCAVILKLSNQEKSKLYNCYYK